MAQGRQRCMAIVVGALALATLCFITPEVQAEEGPNKGKVSLNAGFPLTTAYFFRGILQEKNGVIFQPYADVTFDLYEGEKGLTSVGATVGIWNSIQGESPGDPSDPKLWYEFDFYSALTFGLFEDLEAGVVYTIYTSPNNSFKSYQEIGFRLAYDDSELLGPFALSPHILVAFEFQGGSATAPDQGAYLELGVEPGLTLIQSEKYPVSLSIPLTVGLSLDDYYQSPTDGNDSTFGYFDAGLRLSVPMAFIPADFGSWEFYVRGDFLVLSGTTKTINQDEGFEAIGTVGIALAY